MSSTDALSAFAQRRTQSNRDALVAAYWYLCERGAKKFYRAGVDRADLVQVGAIGLIKAVENFEPALRTPFEAYAWLIVVGELMHYVRDHERIVRTPRPLRALEKRYVHANERLTAALGRTPKPSEIAAELGISVVAVDEVRALRRGASVVSLDAATTKGLPSELAETTRGLSVNERVALLMAIEELADRERMLVLGSFAAGLSQAELGKRLGLSQSQVSKIMKKALSKIQRRVA